MSKIGFSKTDNRRAVMALAVVAMFLATMGVSNVEATSVVSIEANQKIFNIMEDGKVEVILSISSADSRYNAMDLFLKVNWPDGEDAWDTDFTDSNYDSLGNDKITLSKGGSSTVYLKIECEDDCDAGDTRTLQVLGFSDPVFSPGSTRTECGSSDCLTDTTPASSSSNTTTPISITLNVRTGYSHTVDCDDEDTADDIEIYQGSKYTSPYTLTNTGWNKDTYQFLATVTSDSGADTSEWSISSGLTNGKELMGSDTSLTGSKIAKGEIQFTPALNARPGTYDIELVVSSTGGSPDNCEFSVIVPQPDLEIKTTDIDFSHTSAWINTRGDTQKVTIYATVRNNGGNIDSNGVNTEEVTVRFYADSAPIGTSQTVSLKHGEETKLSVEWNPNRAHTSDEVGLVITVKADSNTDIEESNEANNEASKFFKVVRTKSSTPSFFMGFFALIGSVAVAVMLSSYYRNKDLEE